MKKCYSVFAEFSLQLFIVLGLLNAIQSFLLFTVFSMVGVLLKLYQNILLW